MRLFHPLACSASLFLTLLSALFPAQAQAQAPYDLVITNGKIIDGSGNPWFYADVGIQNGKIKFIGRLPPQNNTPQIDAAGLVVAPGFIDMHSHSDTLLLEDGLAQSKIRQGVTTEVLGEGSSAGPTKGKLTARPVTIQGKRVEWSTLGGYFDTAEKSGI